ncbi:MAG: GGDEF domain-containing protein [Flexilinea sp.]|nr:GGDEF domain-containing protein [Flexilinea sp.]
MNDFMSLKRIKLLSYLAAGFFLLVHAAMFFIFRHYNVRPLVFLNLFSIAFYIVMFVLIDKEQLNKFVTLTFLEINAHMFMAIYYTGWEAGYQITLIAICILLAFAEYIGRALHLKYSRFIVFAPISMVTYLVSYYITLRRPTPYVLPDNLYHGFQVAWALIVFLIVFFVLEIFVFGASKAREDLTYQANHDQLTGIPNRVYMSEKLKNVFSRPDRNCYWLAIIDLDDFKIFNDTYGHNCGDYVLVTIAKLLQIPGVEACRWGGEEFLLVGKKGSSTPMEILQQVRQAVNDYKFQYDGNELHMTMTIGVAWLEPGMDVDDWISTADTKLYEGKAAGKNRIIM